MTEWLLLKFRDNYADEFDCEALVVTTRARWERAQAALREAYPNEQVFEAYFGTNEGNTYTADRYLSRFKVHAISLECARDLARVLGRSVPEHTCDDTKITRLSWRFVIEHGVLPRVPGELLHEWLYMLAFDAPPARCAAHGNVIGRCDRGREGVGPGTPACRKEDIEIVHVPDVDYEVLGLGRS